MIELKKLLRIAEDERLSKKDRLKAIKKLNEISPEYLGNLTLENIKTDRARLATEKYRDAILAKAKAQATSNKISKLTEELLEIELKETKEFIGFFEKMPGMFAQSNEQLAKFNKELENKGIERKATEVKRLEDEINRLITIQFAAETGTDNLTASTDDLTKADKKLTKSISSGNIVLTERERLLKKFGIEEPEPIEQKFEFKKIKLKDPPKFEPLEVDFDVKFDFETIEEDFEKTRRAGLTSFEKLKEDWDGIVDSIQEKFSVFAEFSSQIWGQVSDIIGQSIENKMIKLENAHAREVEMIENSRMTEEAKQEALGRLDKRTEKERKKLMRRQAKLEKANAIFSAIINTAAAVVKALTAGPIIGAILAGITAGLGATQIGIIAAQPIPMAEGGIATQPTLALIGEEGPEMVLPLSKAGNFGGDRELKVKITGEDIWLILSRRDKRISFTS